jgi:hypothetical protein
VQTYNASATEPLLSHIDANFFLNGGGWGIHPLDHDDGSNGFADSRNVLFGAGMKNFLGFGRHWTDNLVIRPDFLASAAAGLRAKLPAVAVQVPSKTPAGVPLPKWYYFPACVRSVGQKPWGAARADSYTNNTCVLGAPSPYIFGSCDPNDMNSSGACPSTGNNTFLVRGDAPLSIACGAKRLSLADAQCVGYEHGSTQLASAERTTPAAVVARIGALLGFAP